ncbi:MAG: radical SAM protein [Candidatus Heimdallarchaeota archaeon]|nr:radical SAM protein [Candidatus Heimdallarchaeota archaeon]
MNLKAVDLLLSFKCPAKCRHCSYQAGPNRQKVMKPWQANAYLEELTQTYSLEGLTIHGGEPFLFFKEVMQILQKAKGLAIPKRGIITNGFWADSTENAQRRLLQLKEAGLKDITISADAFHKEFIAIERVQRAVLTSIKVGIEHIWVDSYFLGGVTEENKYNRQTKELLSQLEDLANHSAVEFNRYPVSFKGRAADLAKLLDSSSEIPAGPCPLPFWISGDLRNPGTIEIDPYGNVTLCPGICIGNTNKESLLTILNNYDCSKHPILAFIVETGPKGLLELAKEKGYKQTHSFMDECHLCYSLRKFLRPFYPGQLAPVNCYEDL